MKRFTMAETTANARIAMRISSVSGRKMNPTTPSTTRATVRRIDHLSLRRMRVRARAAFFSNSSPGGLLICSTHQSRAAVALLMLPTILSPTCQWNDSARLSRSARRLVSAAWISSKVARRFSSDATDAAVTSAPISTVGSVTAPGAPRSAADPFAGPFPVAPSPVALTSGGETSSPAAATGGGGGGGGGSCAIGAVGGGGAGFRTVGCASTVFGALSSIVSSTERR